MHALTADRLLYGVIVRREGGARLRVSLQEVLLYEEHDLGNPNKWRNMLWIYMKNLPDFKVNQGVGPPEADAVE